MKEPMVHYGPDWDRMGVKPPNAFAALGDPTRWGATVVLSTLPIVQPLQQGGVTNSGQVISAQCRDPYSRAWTLAGTVTAPADFWGAADGGGLEEWALGAIVTMGVGQMQVIHNFNLRAIVLADGPFYWNADPGDPFYENAGDLVLPFIIPGALIGNAVNVALVMSFRTAVNDVPAVPVRVSMVLCPFDPGAK